MTVYLWTRVAAHTAISVAFNGNGLRMENLETEATTAWRPNTAGEAEGQPGLLAGAAGDPRAAPQRRAGRCRGQQRGPTLFKKVQRSRFGRA